MYYVGVSQSEEREEWMFSLPEIKMNYICFLVINATGIACKSEV